MKLMFASDIHGSLPAAERVLARFAESGAQWLILLGDLLYHGPRNPLPEGYMPAEVAKRLNTVAERIISVRGNCDSEVDQMLLDFPISAPWQQVLAGERRMFLTHGHQYHPDALPPLSAGDILAFGHTHIPRAEWNEQGIGIFNPGSVSLPKGGFPASFGLWDADILSIHTLSSCEEIARLSITP